MLINFIFAVTIPLALTTPTIAFGTERGSFKIKYDFYPRALIPTTYLKLNRGSQGAHRLDHQRQYNQDERLSEDSEGLISTFIDCFI
ncbi:unnamed protein product, partial [Brenthis ino]